MVSVRVGQRVLVILAGGYRHSGEILSADDEAFIHLRDDRNGKEQWIAKIHIERLEVLG